MIYSITSQPVNIKLPNKKGYCLMQGGALGKDHFLPITDDVGENISYKNPEYCDISSLYWIWKNTNDDIVGIAHYRRYLYDIYYWTIIRGYFANSTIDFVEKHILWRCFRCMPFGSKIMSLQHAEKILEEKDAILTVRHLGQTTVKEHYGEAHKIGDLICLRTVINDLSPEYLEDFDAVMDSNEFYFCNLFIMKRDTLNHYCEWLFPILFEADKRIDISKYDVYQKRVIAYLAERLMTVFVRHNHLNVFETPMLVLYKFSKRQL